MGTIRDLFLTPYKDEGLLVRSRANSLLIVVILVMSASLLLIGLFAALGLSSNIVMGLIGLEMVLVAALAALRIGRIGLSSVLGTAAMFAVMLTPMIGSQPESVDVLYRDGFLFAFSFVAVSLFAHRNSHLYGIIIASLLAVALQFFGMILPALLAGAAEEGAEASTAIAALPGYIATSLILALIGINLAVSRRSSEAIVGVAEHEAEKNSARVAEMEGTINASSGGLEIGRELARSADETLQKANAIKSELVAITDGMERLNVSVESSSEDMLRVAESAASFRRRIDDQGSAIVESSASIEQMSSAIQSISASMGSRRELAASLVDTSVEGQEDIDAATEVVQRLLANIENVQRITGVITEIASQTNLLSMNAAIEAAHAGQEGRGFAVVAEEIRNLAERAGTSAGDITQVIRKTVQDVNATADVNRRTTARFGEIQARIADVSSAMDEISGGLEELAAGTREITTAISEIRDGSQAIGETSGAIDSRMSDMSAAMSRIREECQSTAEMVDRIHTSFETIVAESVKVREIGEENTERITELDAAIRRSAARY